MAVPFFKSGDQMRDLNGIAYAGAIAYFYVGGTSTPLVVFQNSGLSIPLGSQITADANGMFPGAFMPVGTYRCVIKTAGGAQLFEIDGVDGTPGSSAGTSVDPNALFQTGYVTWQPIAGTLTGFVRCNGRSIGNAGSGGVERANADCANLFSFLWSNFTDAVCPVSGGRGATSIGDFSGGKTIGTYNMRGRTAVGLDDMGSAAANILQASTNLTTTSASTAATVASAAGIGIGMTVTAANVVAGTTITAISGLNVTLSVGASATNTSAARFSYFGDAQTGGAIGGAQNRVPTVAEMATHSPTGTTDDESAHTHTVPGFIGAAGAGIVTSGNTPAPAITTSAGSAHHHTFTANAIGGGNPQMIIQPSALGTYFMKL